MNRLDHRSMSCSVPFDDPCEWTGLADLAATLKTLTLAPKEMGKSRSLGNIDIATEVCRQTAVERLSAFLVFIDEGHADRYVAGDESVSVNLSS